MKSNLSLPDGAVIDAEGVWSQVIVTPPNSSERPALFLDRDGVALVEVGYLHKAEDAKLIPGAAAFIAAANRRGAPVIIVTNQAGIAYGHYGWNEFAMVQEKFLSDLAAAGAFINGVFACPHHAKGNPPFQHPDHPARKPNPGMLLKAAKMLKLDLSLSWIIGDRAIDIGAGKNAHLAGAIHVLTGHGASEGEREAALAYAGKNYKVMTAQSIADAPLLP